MPVDSVRRSKRTQAQADAQRVQQQQQNRAEAAELRKAKARERRRQEKEEADAEAAKNELPIVLKIVNKGGKALQPLFDHYSRNHSEQDPVSLLTDDEGGPDLPPAFTGVNDPEASETKNNDKTQTDSKHFQSPKQTRRKMSDSEDDFSELSAGPDQKKLKGNNGLPLPPPPPPPDAGAAEQQALHTEIAELKAKIAAVEAETRSVGKIRNVAKAVSEGFRKTIDKEYKLEPAKDRATLAVVPI